MSFLEMPNGFTDKEEDPSDKEPTDEKTFPLRNERFTAIRARDVTSGRFVAGPTVTKSFVGSKAKSILEALVGAGSSSPVQNMPRRKKKVQPNMSVTLTRKKKP